MARLRDALELEWLTLSSGPTAEEAARRWGEAEPALAGLVSAAAVVRSANRRGAVRRSNDILGALLRLAPEDGLARRALLQTLLPALNALALRYRCAEERGDERLQTVLVLALERIDDLAGQSISWPAVAIAGHVRDRLRRTARQGLLEVPLDEAVHVTARPERTAAERLTGVVLDNLHLGTLGREDAALLYTTRIAGHSPARVAACRGLEPGLVRTRLHRAERRLVDAGHAVC